MHEVPRCRFDDLLPACRLIAVVQGHAKDQRCDFGSKLPQNAALARAVIGGLLFATPTTLLIVPYLFAMLRSRNDGKAANGVFEELPN